METCFLAAIFVLGSEHRFLDPGLTTNSKPGKVAEKKGEDMIETKGVEIRLSGFCFGFQQKA